MRRTLLSAIVAGALVAPAAAAQDRPVETDSTFTLRTRLAAGAWVRVYTFNGDVEFREGTGDQVEIRGEKRGRRTRWDRVFFESKRDGDNLTVCAVYGDEAECGDEGIRGNMNSNNVGTRFTVTLPRGARVRAGSGNGDVVVRVAAAEARASTGNGEVEVAGVRGPVHASTGNGALLVEDAGGPVEASTGNGRVTINTATGPVSASSGNGNIDVRMARLAGEGDMEFRTGNGRVSVAVPASFEGEVVTSTGHGRLESDFPLTVSGRMDTRNVRATIGRGGRRIRMSSGNGDLELRKM